MQRAAEPRSGQAMLTRFCESIPVTEEMISLQTYMHQALPAATGAHSESQTTDTLTAGQPERDWPRDGAHSRNTTPEVTESVRAGTHCCQRKAF